MHLKLSGKLPRFKGKSAKVPGERPRIDKRWTGCTLGDIRFSVSSDLMISVLACHPPFSAIEPANPKGGLEVISRQLRSAKGTNGR